MQLKVQNLLRASIVCFALGGLTSLPGNAQTLEETTKIVQDLSPRAQETLKQLTGLDKLPDGEWRMHDGDIPHGESTTLRCVMAGLKTACGSSDADLMARTEPLQRNREHHRRHAEIRHAQRSARPGVVVFADTYFDRVIQQLAREFPS
jgi:hypothetical protein